MLATGFRHNILPNDIVKTRLAIEKTTTTIPAGALLRVISCSDAQVCVRFANNSYCLPVYQVEVCKNA